MQVTALRVAAGPLPQLPVHCDPGPVWREREKEGPTMSRAVLPGNSSPGLLTHPKAQGHLAVHTWARWALRRAQAVPPPVLMASAGTEQTRPDGGRKQGPSV